jgi:hypothetical protein
MRCLVAVLLTACFALPQRDADLTPNPLDPTPRQVLDAGAAPDDAGATTPDGGVADAGPVALTSCSSNADCTGSICVFALIDAQMTQVCLPYNDSKLANDELARGVNGDCVRQTTTVCDDGQGCPAQARLCMPGVAQGNGSFCHEQRGQCFDDGDCAGRFGQQGSGGVCWVNNEEANRSRTKLRGRCVAPGDVGLEQIRGGQIGFWVEEPGSSEPVCRFSVCDPENLDDSCGAYLAGTGAFALRPTDVSACAQREVLPQGTGSTCDWRDCGSDPDCVHRYHVVTARCSAEGWCVSPVRNESHSILLHSWAHAYDQPESIRIGFRGCSPECSRGSLCSLDRGDSVDCIDCNPGNDCSEWGAVCRDRACVFECEEDTNCEDGQRCDGGICVIEDHGGDPGPNHGDGPCAQAACPEACVEVWARDGQNGQGPEQRRAVCTPPRCDAQSGCGALGVVCDVLAQSCTFHGFCSNGGDCGTGGECTLFIDPQSVQQTLCLDLNSSCVACAEGQSCHLGFCGVLALWVDQQSPNCATFGAGLTAFGGFCPRRAGPCDNASCDNAEVCRESQLPTQNGSQARAFCVPPSCAPDRLCPVPNFCENPESNGSCEFWAFCDPNNGNGDCPQNAQCHSLESALCLSEDTDCGPRGNACAAGSECYAGFCGSVTNSCDGIEVRGTCVPNR